MCSALHAFSKTPFSKSHVYTVDKGLFIVTAVDCVVLKFNSLTAIVHWELRMHMAQFFWIMHLRDGKLLKYCRFKG